MSSSTIQTDPGAARPVSVVVVSRGRPLWLRRCLLSLSQQDDRNFELVVVADAPGLVVARTLPFARHVKFLANDGVNLSAARNAGIAAAAGAVVAFIDDDAAAEPTWLSRLVAPIRAGRAEAATGFTRGRNGISLQWGAARVDMSGADRPLPLGEGEGVFAPTADGAVKLHGTNMAISRKSLRALGGFDPAYRFYLEDADLSLRLAMAGARVAVVPGAQVQHGFAPSARRQADRAPRDLREIGASEAVFLRRHGARETRGIVQDAREAAQRRRLLAWLQRGGLDPMDLRRLMAGYRAGWQEGLSRRLAPLAPLEDDPPAFQPMPGIWGPAVHLSGRLWHRRRLLKEARARAARGERVSLLLISRSTLWHRERFDDSGVWIQSGGLWGRSDRTDPLVALQRFGTRARRERARIADVRGLG
ncbi:glycosyltransferase family 2 protein [Poseidonocella sedimentorum]|nr:glycosyltransferase [Poseidonocella sedimentorum]